MTENELKLLASDCYAALGAAMPAPSSPAWAMWAQICASVPPRSLGWIRSRIIGLEAMPRNFGKAVLTLGREWRNENAAARGIPTRCPDCDREFPGFFLGWKQNEQGLVYERLIPCLCNNDPNEKGVKKSKAQAAREGFVVRHAKDGRNYARFVRERFCAKEGQGGQ